jgi:hypothetical protein
MAKRPKRHKVYLEAVEGAFGLCGSFLRWKLA